MTESVHSDSMMALPKTPMSPIQSPVIPEGPEWCYQLKWDGVRTLARLDGSGGVELFSKRIELRNAAFPEIVALLKSVQVGACLVDGEIVYFDGVRPNFQLGRLGGVNRKPRDDLIYVMFDLLGDGSEDLRPLPFRERFRRLSEKFPKKNPRLFVTDLYEDGQALWEWVQKHEWEGIVSKRLDSPYTEGKKHNDWFKKRKELQLTAEVVGIKLNNGQVASLVLRYEDRYIGHVSGLDQNSKRLLEEFMRKYPGECPFPSLTPGMKKSEVMWLSVPFPCRVAALEFTDSGILRHPRLLGFGTS